MYDAWFKTFNAIQTADTSHLVRKTDYDTKIDKIEKKNYLIMDVLNILLLKN